MTETRTAAEAVRELDQITGTLADRREHYAWTNTGGSLVETGTVRRLAGDIKSARLDWALPPAHVYVVMADDTLAKVDVQTIDHDVDLGAVVLVDVVVSLAGRELDRTSFTLDVPAVGNP